MDRSLGAAHASWLREAGDAPDRAAVARLRNVLAGGTRGAGGDWQLAAEMEAAWPGTGDLITRAHWSHRLMAAQAVTTADSPAQAVIFTAAGLPPPDGPLHAWAAKLVPDTRFAYVHGDPTLSLIARAVIEGLDRKHVTVIDREPEDPEAWIDGAAAQELLALGPASVHVVLAAHKWPGWLAAEVLTTYRRALPSGSSVCMTLATATGPLAGKYTAYMSRKAGARIFAHTLEQVAGWIGFAGLRVSRVTYARPAGPRHGARAPGPAAEGRPGRVIEAVALVPLRPGADVAEVPGALPGPALAAAPLGHGDDLVHGELRAAQVGEPGAHLVDALGEVRERERVGTGVPGPDFLKDCGALFPQFLVAGPFVRDPWDVRQDRPGACDGLHPRVCPFPGIQSGCGRAGGQGWECPGAARGARGWPCLVFTVSQALHALRIYTDDTERFVSTRSADLANRVRFVTVRV